MHVQIRYGGEASLAVDLPEGVLREHFTGPTADDSIEPSDAALRVFEQPLGMPPLSKMVVPGDQVALALDEVSDGLPQVVRILVEALLACEIEPAGISCLVKRGESNDPRSELPTEIASKVQLVVHDPEDRKQWRYLAADEQDQPIYLDRVLVDADVMIPVSWVRPRPGPFDQSAFASLYPRFSDGATQKRLGQPLGLDESRPEPIEDDEWHTEWPEDERLDGESEAGSAGSPREPDWQGSQHDDTSVSAAAQGQQVRELIDRVGWLLGVQFAVHLVSGGAQRLLGVTAGDPRQAFAEARQLADSAWQFHPARRASLVVASVIGGPSQQTWENVARALASADELVDDGGAVVVLSQLSEPPSREMIGVAESEDRWEALRRLGGAAGSAMEPMLQLLDVRERAHIYLLSQLDEADVEELGITALAGASELGRLAKHHESCIVLENAQEAVVQAT